MIPSFKVDHTKLKPGLYVSRVDKLGLEIVTTFDVRVCKPNRDMMSPAIAHTIEHLMADYMRNKSSLKDYVLYFGPMGCLTGFYLILRGVWTSAIIKDSIAVAFKECSVSKVMPGASEKECGNYRLNDLKGATLLCKKFASYLSSVGEDKLTYPM